MKDGRTIKIEFSARHLVVLVGLIAVAAVILPVSVQAATGSSVNIVDPNKSTYKAKVSGVGALLTGLCSWNNISTPTCATVTNHSLNTVVNGGFVNAGTDVPPLFPLQSVISISDTAKGTLAGTTNNPSPFDPNEEVEITSVTFANISAVQLNAAITMANATGLSCSGSESPLATEVVAVVPGNQTVHLAFPQPIVLAGDGSNTFCVNAGPTGSNASGSDVKVTIVGYGF